jgi:hypothetical protein
MERPVTEDSTECWRRFLPNQRPPRITISTFTMAEVASLDKCEILHIQASKPRTHGNGSTFALQHALSCGSPPILRG